MNIRKENENQTTRKQLCAGPEHGRNTSGTRITKQTAIVDQIKFPLI